MPNHRDAKKISGEMNWISALLEMPSWAVGLLLIGPGTIFGIVGPLLMRGFFRLEQLKINNEVAGFTIAVIGAIYAVVLGFATIVVWEKFREAESAVMKEATALSSLSQLANAADKPAAEQIRAKIRAYERAIVNDEWPAMSRGHQSPIAAKALDELYAAVLAQNQGGAREIAILRAQIAGLNDISQARGQRLSLATGVVPGAVWVVLVIGAFFTVAYTFFFGAANLSAQVIMNAMLSFLIFLTLFAILDISHPFSGKFQISPEDIEAQLHQQP